MNAATLKLTLPAALIALAVSQPIYAHAQSAAVLSRDDQSESDYTSVATISTDDKVSDHVRSVLERADLHPMMAGSLGYGVFVRSAEVERATAVLADHISTHPGCPIWLHGEVTLHTTHEIVPLGHPAAPAHPHPPGRHPGYGGWIGAQIGFVIG